MKKIILTGALLLSVAASFTSCREEKKDVDVTIEQAGESIEEAAQDTEEAVEGGFQAAGEAIDNAVNDTQEAGESIENAVDEIKGDD